MGWLKLVEYGSFAWPIVIVSLLAGCNGDTKLDAPRAGTRENGRVLVLTDKNFEREVLDSPRPVLVDFWAAWCQPCLEMKPVIRELAEEYAGRLKIGQLNTENNPFTTAKYEIETVPALLLFRDGELVERVNGRQPRDDLVRLLESALAHPE